MTSSIRREAEALYDEKIVPSGRLAAVNYIEAFAKAQRVKEVEAIGDGIKAMEYHYLVEHYCNTWKDAFAHWLSQRKKELEP